MYVHIFSLQKKSFLLVKALSWFLTDPVYERVGFQLYDQNAFFAVGMECCPLIVKYNN